MLARPFHILLKALVALVLLLAGGVGVLVFRASLDREDAFFVANARLADPDYLDRLRPKPAELVRQTEFGFMAHRIAKGTGTVIGHRLYSAGEFHIVDDERYRKTTIWLNGPVPQAGLVSNLRDTTKVLVLHSQGGSAWPAQDCSGVVKYGNLVIRKDRESLLVELTGTFDPRTGRFPSICNTEAIDVRFKARPFAFDELTPWLGAAGDHPYAETYR